MLTHDGTPNMTWLPLPVNGTTSPPHRLDTSGIVEFTCWKFQCGLSAKSLSSKPSGTMSIGNDTSSADVATATASSWSRSACHVSAGLTRADEGAGAGDGGCTG